jgi:hypothetical protein
MRASESPNAGGLLGHAQRLFYQIGCDSVDRIARRHRFAWGLLELRTLADWPFCSDCRKHRLNGCIERSPFSGSLFAAGNILIQWPWDPSGRFASVANPCGNLLPAQPTVSEVPDGFCPRRVYVIPNSRYCRPDSKSSRSHRRELVFGLIVQLRRAGALVRRNLPGCLQSTFVSR